MAGIWICLESYFGNLKPTNFNGTRKVGPGVSVTLSWGERQRVAFYVLVWLLEGGRGVEQ